MRLPDTKTISLLLFLMLTAVIRLAAQGCSDAGFCTINSFKPDAFSHLAELSALSEQIEPKSQFKAGVNYGTADNDIVVTGIYLEYNRSLGDRWSVDAKMTALGQRGNGISVFGAGDIFLNANYRAGERTRMTLGLKIPLTDGNRMLDGLPLPMDYQSSLGTLDLIAGIGHEIGRLQVMAALQQPLTQNSNTFLAEAYPMDSKLHSIQSTNAFRRSGDVLLRVSYPLQLGRRLRFTPSLLPIFHLADDRFTDANGVEQIIAGSQGLTLNGNLYFDYQIDRKNAFQVNMGVPFVVRESRPDGLTRGFIVNAEYRIRF